MLRTVRAPVGFPGWLATEVEPPTVLNTMTTSSPRKRLAAGAGLLVVTLVAYLPAFRGGFVFDDEDYIVNNWALRSLDGLRVLWLDHSATAQYYPLTCTTFWVEYHLWGLNPAGYHVVNVVLHGVNAVLFWMLLRRLQLPGAWFAAALFALHPVHVESVAWVTERKNTLSGLFYLLAALAYLRFRPLAGAAPDRPGSRWGFYVAALAAYAAALLSKTTTIALPAAILLVIWWKCGRVKWRDIAGVAPFFVLAFVSALGTLTQESADLARAPHTVHAYTLLERVLVAGRVPWFYLGKLVWPTDLAFIYARWAIDPRVWWQYLYPLASLALLLGLWLGRRRIGRGPLVAGLYFVGTLLPVLGFADYGLMRYTFVADHFLYLPSLGVLALLAAVAAAASRQLGSSGGRAAPVLAGLTLLALGTGTARQNLIYADVETLWRDTLAHDPQSPVAHYNLARHLIDTDRAAEAVAHLEAALRAQPGDVDTLNNLGVAYVKTGRIDDALRTLEQALRLRPDDDFIHTNLGVLYARRGNIEAAIKHFTRALELNPRREEARANLNTLLARSRRPPSSQPMTP